VKINSMTPTDEASYFKHRQVSRLDYQLYAPPAYLASRIPQDKEARILDFGCGFGQFLSALHARGYCAVEGYDIEPEAIAFCRAQGLRITDGNSVKVSDLAGNYDFILTSHVIEHIPKDSIISTLRDLRGRLSPGGSLMVCVPNAQSNTAAYWAYEDFTHQTLFTSGSLYYVLSKAGFSTIEFVDTDCTEGVRRWIRPIRKVLLALYRANYMLWNRVTGSATHSASPNIFSYELKALAKS
jgi:2-polyprenyl-3-methyl-5-hydroxy-6-metoxy-1,4-benzoquinol methylase